jgi:micrococcal nuclease
MRTAIVVGMLVGVLCGPATAGCRIDRVIDGDTVQMRCGTVDHRVRLLGYDSPEVTRPRCAAEFAAGQRATARLGALVASGSVTTVSFEGQDRYGRDLAWISIGGRDVATHMLASPWALPYSGKRRPDWCGAG